MLKIKVLALFLILLSVTGGLFTYSVEGDLAFYVLFTSCFMLAVFLGTPLYSRFNNMKPLQNELNEIGEEIRNQRDFKKNWKQTRDRLSIVESCADGIWDWDIRANRVYWSDRICEILQLEPGSLGDDFSVFKQMLSSSDLREFEEKLRDHLVSDEPFSLEFGIEDAQLNKRFLLIRGKARRDSRERPIRMGGTLGDVTEQNNLKEKVKFQALYDSITELPNRKFFMDQLDHLLEKASHRHDYLMGVMLIDIDRLKNVNDLFGHSIGDVLIKRVAERINSCKRSGDMLARTGGDEFAIILDDIKLGGDANTVANRIRNELDQPFKIEGFEVRVSASIGIAYNEVGMDNREVLLAHSDAALQKAKKRALGSCEVFTSGMREKAMQIMKLESDLRQALELKKFELVYQPIINLQDYHISGFEALVRWKRNENEIVYPLEFIPMAEDTGIILGIGEWILRTACTQAKEWVHKGYPDITVAVNFSGKQFMQQNLPLEVERVLEQVGLPARNLKIEITETTAMSDDVENNREIMKSLNRMGVQISIDDFGTGYSSLSYLKKYHVQHLKIDKSFVKDLPDDPEDSAITSTIISMANNLNLKLIAEGVETQEQLRFLADRGCDEVQGYYFSHPVSAEASTAMLGMDFSFKAPQGVAS
jgi:diguanylate cyclase (GGDEF)-like protein